MLLIRLLILAPLLGVAHASDVKTFQTGIATIANTSLYKGEHKEILILPLILFEYDNLYFNGEKLGYTFYENKGINLGVIINPTILGYHNDANLDLDGMEDRNMDFSSGLDFSYQFGPNKITSKILYDFFNQHNGYTLDIKYTRLFQLSNQDMIMSYVGIEHFSSKKSTYYYGVRENESTNNRSSYKLGGATNPYIGVKVVYTLNKKWSILGQTEYKYLSGDIFNSPIVDSKYTFSGSLGVLYSW